MPTQQPPQNYWDGNTFVVPGFTPGYTPAPTPGTGGGQTRPNPGQRPAPGGGIFDGIGNIFGSGSGGWFGSGSPDFSIFRNNAARQPVSVPQFANQNFTGRGRFGAGMRGFAGFDGRPLGPEFPDVGAYGPTNIFDSAFGWSGPSFGGAMGVPQPTIMPGGIGSGFGLLDPSVVRF